MSSNRLMYDTCATYERTVQSTKPLLYALDKNKFENCNECRMELGILGGNAVSHIAGNLIDLESDLRGQTRYSSTCSTQKFQAPNGDVSRSVHAGPRAGAPEVDTKLRHLPPCQMIRYKPVPLPPAIVPYTCSNGRSDGHVGSAPSGFNI